MCAVDGRGAIYEVEYRAFVESGDFLVRCGRIQAHNSSIGLVDGRLKSEVSPGLASSAGARLPRKCLAPAHFLAFIFWLFAEVNGPDGAPALWYLDLTRHRLTLIALILSINFPKSLLILCILVKVKVTFGTFYVEA